MSNIKTFEEWKNFLDEHPRLGVYKVYKATFLEDWAWRHIPYWYYLPLTKRQRVKLRRKIRYAWARRASKDMVKALQRVYNDKPVKLMKPLELNEEDWSWTIITKH